MLTFTIYVIDDEQTIRDGITLTLEADYRVKSFQTAESAIDALATDPADLILLDVGLPGMNGIEALREIKSVIGNIPPNLSREELEVKLNNEPAFRRKLTSRLVRLFGLRNEHIPFIDSQFVDLIDKQLLPLFDIECVTYTFKTDKITEFANFSYEAISLVASIEEKLTQEYRNQLE